MHNTQQRLPAEDSYYFAGLRPSRVPVLKHKPAHHEHIAELKSPVWLDRIQLFGHVLANLHGFAAGGCLRSALLC